jgi:hypothetical protein
VSHAEQIAAVLIYLRQFKNLLTLLGGFSAELSAVWVCTDPALPFFYFEISFFRFS